MAVIVPPPTDACEPLRICRTCGKTRLGCRLNRRLNRPLWTLIHAVTP